MTRQLFERQLREMQDEVLILASMVEKAIARSVEALRNRDVALSEAVIRDDAAINKKRYEIEEKCIHTIALQQPMAADLRTLVAVLFIVTELERMADHAEGIGRINLMLPEGPLPRPLGAIGEMADRAVDMLRRSITAFIERDADAARRICDEDDVIDRLYDDSYHALIQEMIRDPDEIQPMTYLIWTSHNLERIGDRVTNICERVIFMVTGNLEEINVSRY
ncbi:MAG TPA: phosphate signaling complex protein PhoU [Dehalococcoidia bacterium]|nr:phosphate signaling complex protein PhoU [Dehalococcoidia bacterium]